MKRRWMVATGAALALALLTIPAIGDFSFGRTSSLDADVATAAACEPDAGAANLNFTLTDMDGNDVRLDAYKGKVILLNFWATWCGPCKVEIPGFIELQDKYRDQGLVVLGLSVDDPVDKIKAFAEQFEINYPLLVGKDREDFQEAYGPVWGIPVSFYIARDGTMCLKHMGLATKEQSEKIIKALL